MVRVRLGQWGTAQLTNRTSRLALILLEFYEQEARIALNASRAVSCIGTIDTCEQI